jgi:hypothetical protein
MEGGKEGEEEGGEEGEEEREEGEEGGGRDIPTKRTLGAVTVVVPV